MATDGHELQRQGVGQELEEPFPAEEVEQEGQKSMIRRFYLLSYFLPSNLLEWKYFETVE